MAQRASFAWSCAALLGGCFSCGDRAEGPPPTPTTTSAEAPEVMPLPGRCEAIRSKAFTRAAVGSASSSAIDLVRAGDRLFALVADPDEKALHVVDTADMREVSVTPLDGRPEHVLATDDGRVLVTLRDAGVVIALEPADASLSLPLERRCTGEVGLEPWAIAHAAGRVLVTGGFDASLAILDDRELAPIAVSVLSREPRGILMDGHRAFVTHAVGGLISVVDLDDLGAKGRTISVVIDAPKLPEGEPRPKAPPRPRGSTQGYAIAAVVGQRADGSQGTLRILSPQATADTGQLSAPVSAGYGASNQTRTFATVVAVVDPVALNSITDDATVAGSREAPDSCILPRGVAVSGTSLFVACLDADVVVELDARLADPMSLVRRAFQVGAGPTAVALDGKGSLFVYASFDRTLSRIPLDGGDAQRVTLWQRSDVRRDERLAAGRALFHTSRDARIGAGRACAACHPEGRDDGLVWTSPDGPRQTPTLAGRLEGTAPYGWFGEHATLREHLDDTFRRLGGTGFGSSERGKSDVDALIAYVSSLTLPSRSTPTRYADLAERGKAVYLAYGCQGCHPDGRSDGKRHDVGSGRDGERRVEFDAPSLLGVGASAPYFHDGRYETLADLLSATDTRMFSGTPSAPDREALLVYLRSL